MSWKIRVALCLLTLLLLFSVWLNVRLYHLGLSYYHDAEAVRLDPTSARHFQSLNAVQQPPESGQKRIVLVGDSRIEQWESLPSIEQTQWINRGRGGDTTAQVLLRLERDVLALNPHMVVLQVGINDLKGIGSFPHRKQEILEDCQANLERILNRLASEPVHVVVLTIFPVGPVPLARRPVWSDETLNAVETVNRWLRARQGARLTVVDCDPFFAVEGRMSAPYARDAFHLTAAGYETLNSKIGPILHPLLTGKGF